MASDRGKPQAYCKVCSKHFSFSHGGLTTSVDMGKAKSIFKRIFKKNHGFSARCPAFFFQKLKMSACDIQQCGILICAGSDKHVQPPVSLETPNDVQSVD